MANLIINGDFESGNANGWQNIQNQNSLVGIPGYNSTYMFKIGNYSIFSKLFEQNINTVVNNIYSLKYVLKNPASQNFKFDARINGVIVNDSSINSPVSFDWKEYAFSFKASSSVTNISFFAVISFLHPSYCYIDNISVVKQEIPCFKEDTKILTDKGYIPIQDLRKGDLVKTALHDFKPIYMIGKRDMYHPALQDRIKDQLYKCSQSEYPTIFEPLVITGCHSILVDDFTSEEQKQKAIEVNGRIFVTDRKYRLPALADPRASVYKTPGNYTIYHLALENDNYYFNYGIYANGLLVETCSKRYLNELSNMTLIE